MKDGWKYDFGLAGIPSVILLVGFYFCPESPRLADYQPMECRLESLIETFLDEFSRWLVQVGRVEEAKKVLERLRRKGDAVEKVAAKM